MKNLMNEITTEYLNSLESGYIYDGGKYYEIIQHPDIPGVLLRKRYELAVFKNDKLLIYPRVKGIKENDKAFKLYDKDTKFMLPSVYRYHNLLEEIDYEHIKLCAKSNFHLEVSNVHKRDTYIDLYKKPYEIIFDNNKYIISGEFVTVFTMQYQIISPLNNNTYDKDDDILKYVNVDSDNMSSLWYEYSILLAKYSGTKYAGLLKILSEYITNNNIKDSMHLEYVIISEDHTYLKDNTLRCFELHLKEFIYDNPRYANVIDGGELLFMYDLLHMISIDIPTRTVMKPCDIKEILSFILNHYEYDNTPYRAEGLFGLNTTSIFIRSDYTNISNEHSNSVYRGIPTHSFYNEFYPIIDLIVGMLDELSDPTFKNKYPKNISSVKWALKSIYKGYKALIPEYKANGIFGKYSAGKIIDTKSISKNVRLSV